MRFTLQQSFKDFFAHIFASFSAFVFRLSVAWRVHPTVPVKLHIFLGFQQYEADMLRLFS